MDNVNLLVLSLSPAGALGSGSMYCLRETLYLSWIETQGNTLLDFIGPTSEPPSGSFWVSHLRAFLLRALSMVSVPGSVAKSVARHSASSMSRTCQTARVQVQTGSPALYVRFVRFGFRVSRFGFGFCIPGFRFRSFVSGIAFRVSGFEPRRRTRGTAP